MQKLKKSWKNYLSRSLTAVHCVAILHGYCEPRPDCCSSEKLERGGIQLQVTTSIQIYKKNVEKFLQCNLPFFFIVYFVFPSFLVFGNYITSTFIPNYNQDNNRVSLFIRKHLWNQIFIKLFCTRLVFSKHSWQTYDMIFLGRVIPE